MLKNAWKTFKRSLKMKKGFLLFLGMIAGLILSWVGSNLVQGSHTTLVTMFGVIVSLVCANGYAQLITILSMNPDGDLNA